MRKIGGLYHWRIGRLGGSFYIARRKAVRSGFHVTVALGDPLWDSLRQYAI